jgi:hypothetical protein
MFSGGDFSGMAVFAGKLYAFNNSQILNSTNGFNWSVVNNNIPNVSLAAMGVFNGKIYAGSGPNGAPQLYSSPDGVNWSLVWTANGAREISAIQGFNGNLYVATGQGGGPVNGISKLVPASAVISGADGVRARAVAVDQHDDVRRRLSLRSDEPGDVHRVRSGRKRALGRPLRGACRHRGRLRDLDADISNGLHQ